MQAMSWEFRSWEFQFLWSIGLYEGSSPFSLRPAAAVTNPVLTSASVTDVPSRFVADPFHLRVDDTFHLFFEVWNAQEERGEIAHATSADARSWTYDEVVLREPFHLSYPWVVRVGDDFYMVPETRQAQAIRLYRAEDFPHRWTFVRELVQGDFADATPFEHDGRWWMFVHRGLDELRLFSAATLDGDWSEHPASPIVAGNRSLSRPAGRVLAHEGRLVRFAQDGWPQYGTCVRALEIDVLTADHYREHELPESPIIGATGTGWSSVGMHHVDYIRGDGDGWLAIVDGYTPGGISLVANA
jgi:hypothetical protein